MCSCILGEHKLMVMKHLRFMNLDSRFAYVMHDAKSPKKLNNVACQDGMTLKDHDLEGRDLVNSST